jgi:hypothetical protein
MTSARPSRRRASRSAVSLHNRRMASTKASGRNVRESERSTVQVKLRLPPDVAEELDEYAARKGVTRSGAVALLLEKEK